ncbi:hypothetical protein SPAN111604_02015 [Sphingomonas antarctica]|uniref:hypothetical protein n=1 Tax=Sphingomonas antarctica TaxID=2040274 RepID=UPI0039EC5CA3
MAALTFTFTAQEIAAINIPANGQGGFQSLIRTLQAQLNPATGTMVLTDAQVGRVVRYMSYRPGGFEGRLAAALRRQLHIFID